MTFEMHNGLFQLSTGKLQRTGNVAAGSRKQLLQARADLVRAIEQIRATTADESRPMTDAERQTLEQINAAMGDVSAALSVREAENEVARNARPVRDPNQDAAQRARQQSGLEQDAAGANGNRVVGYRGARFAQLFGTQQRSMDGWRDGDEFLSVVGAGLHDQRLRASHTTVDGPHGGYAVPGELSARWLDTALEGEIVRPRATTWPMKSKTLAVPRFDESDRSSGEIAGFGIQWLPETGTADLQTGELDLLELTAHVGAILAEASNQLAADGVNFESQLERAIVKAIGYGLDRAFIFGTGAGQPLGALASGNPALIVQTKEAGQAAATINYTNLLKMFSRLASASVANAVWLAHPSTIPQLATLTIAIGDGGAHVPVMTSSNGQFTILTRPVIFTEKAKPLGTQGDISLVDFTQYAVGLRQGITMDKSAHVGFVKNTMTYRLLLRMDGQPTWKSAAQPPNNAATLSPYVTLETRA